MTNEKQEVFVPILFDKYKENKIKGLKAQLFLKKSLIFLKQIEETKKIKNQYKRELRRKLNEIKKEIEKLEKKFPKTKENKLAQYNPNTHFSQIDEELREIQQKLKALNI